MTKDEALKLALEALDRADKISGYPNNKKAITAIREALAQPEQEPEAWYDKHGMVTHDPFEGVTSLYTTPPQPELVIDKSAAVRIATSLGWEPKRTWMGLTDEDFLEACRLAENGNYLVAFQRIQAKLKEKNA